MVSNVKVEDIHRDITSLHDKISRCNTSKEGLMYAIAKENDTIQELNFYIREEKHNKTDKHKYDIVSLEANVERCHNNINTFNEVIGRENDNIKKFEHMIEVLTRDLARPTEIFFNAETGQLITK